MAVLATGCYQAFDFINCQQRCAKDCDCVGFAQGKPGGGGVKCYLFDSTPAFIDSGKDQTEYGPDDDTLQYYNFPEAEHTHDAGITFTCDQDGQDVYYKEDITIEAVLDPAADKDVAVLFAIDSNPSGQLRRGQDYGTSFPATNLAKVSRGSKSASWTISNKMGKVTDGTKEMKVDVIYVANAKVHKEHPEDDTDVVKSMTFNLKGGKRT
jgi:hypothetical protein